MSTYCKQTELDLVPTKESGVDRLAGYIGAGLRRLRALRRILRNRREVMMLSDFTDAQLADIGLTRNDVRGALSGSPVDDPSAYLIAAAGFRRFHGSRED